MFSPADLEFFRRIAQANEPRQVQLIAPDQEAGPDALRTGRGGCRKTAGEVTCLVPFAGEHEHLPACLEAVFGQSVVPGTLILGLDHSGPAPAIPPRLASAVRMLRASSPGAGPFRMMEELIAAAPTPILMLQDSDDECLPQRLEMQLAALNDDRLDAVGTAAVNFHGETIESIGIFPEDPRKALEKACGHVVLYGTLVLRREAYYKSGGFRHFERFGLDTEFVNRLAAHGPVRNLSLPLTMKRTRSDSLTGDRRTGFGSAPRQAVARMTRESWAQLYRPG
jgi:hypothetical protein